MTSLKLIHCYLLNIFFLTLCCITVYAQTTTINYNTFSGDFINPERGFYRYSATFASNYETLDEGTLIGYRSLHSPSSANYNIYSSLVFRYFVLDDFVNGIIAQDFLDSMSVDFANARSAGVKVIVRFAYTIAPDSGNCPVEWICPPYGDADKNRILGHINQLKQVLHTNQDVIALVQMGFIGTWGENYYTDHFGDASPNGQGFLSSQNWTNRKEILEALLNAVPTDRMVQVRYPQIKQKYIYGNNAGTSPLTSPPIASAQAYNGSDIARIGFHNDCLLADAEDFGTYVNYDNPPTGDTANLKPYFAHDSKFVAVGGETCSDTLYPYNDCLASGGGAEKELKRLHYSYLNAEYNNAVNNDWAGICMDNIKKQLGYRLELQNGTFTNEVEPGQIISVHIVLKNIGYAAPFNPRGVELILRNNTTNEKWYARLSDDPRFWLGHDALDTISTTLCIPSNMPYGNYTLLINLPDPIASIYARPEYAIRLANRLPNGDNVWEASTGYNTLGHVLSVQSIASGVACNGENGFMATSAYSTSCATDLFVIDMTVPDGQYYSQGVLTSENATIETMSNVLYRSDTSILLKAGFAVKQGAIFEAQIGPCSGN